VACTKEVRSWRKPLTISHALVGYQDELEDVDVVFSHEQVRPSFCCQSAFTLIDRSDALGSRSCSRFSDHLPCQASRFFNAAQLQRRAPIVQPRRNAMREVGRGDRRQARNGAGEDQSGKVGVAYVLVGRGITGLRFKETFNGQVSQPSFFMNAPFCSTSLTCEPLQQNTVKPIDFFLITCLSSFFLLFLPNSRGVPK